METEFFNRFFKNTQISFKIQPVGAKFFCADGHDKHISRFSQFFNAPRNEQEFLRVWKLVFVTYLKTGVRHLFENWCSSPIWKLVFITYLKTGVRHLFENWCSSPIWKLVFVTYLKTGVRHLFEDNSGISLKMGNHKHGLR